MFFKRDNFCKRKKELYKIVVARSDITAALNACSLFLSRVKDFADDLYIPLVNAIIVCYSRPFSRNKPLGSLPKKWHGFDNSRFQEIHEGLLELRNKTVAHSDLEIRKVSVLPKGAPVRETGLRTESLGVIISNRLLPIEIFPEIRNLCLDLGHRLNLEVKEELELLFGDKDLPPEEFELTFD
jgi:hypothetical protein